MNGVADNVEAVNVHVILFDPSVAFTGKTDAQFVPDTDRVKEGVFGSKPRLPTTISETEQLGFPLTHFGIVDGVVTPIPVDKGPKFINFEKLATL